ncbi:MAG: hypothetical protein Q7J12_04110 [Syntrophales bacterium]|nr:hypothetical protein [Syntrophales bacterium]
MGITQLYSNKEYFMEVSPQSFSCGQLCWLPVPEIAPIPQILDVERKNSIEHEEIRFILRNANRRDDFRKRDRGLPIKYLNLYSNEELLVHKAKRRPGVILCSKVDAYPDIAHLLRQQGRKHLQEDSIFVIPCYHTETDDDPGGFPPAMVMRIRHLLYRQFFYMPKHVKFKEAIARFDRIQMVSGRDRAAIEPSDVSLSEEVLNIFLSSFVYCIMGIADTELSAALSIIREAYKG